MPVPRGPTRSALHFLTDTNLFIAACAGFSAAGILPYFGYAPDQKLAWFVFFGTLFTYNAQRRVGDLHPARKPSKIGGVLMVLSFIALLALLPALPPTEIAVLSVSGVVSLAYAYPVVSFRGAKVSLRRLPYLKLWLIVLVWLLSCTVAPMLQAKTFLLEAHPFNPLFIVFQQGAFIAALTIPFDIRDIGDDFPTQRTVPQMLGVRGAVRLAIILMALSGLAAPCLAAIGTVTWTMATAQLVLSVLGGIAVSFANPDRGRLYHFIALDGMLLLQGVTFILLFRL